MKIVCEAMKPSVLAWAAAASMDNAVIVWNPATKNGFDMMDEVQPDLVVASANTFEKYGANKLFRNIICLQAEKIEDDLANTCQYLGGVYNDRYRSQYVYFSDTPVTPEILADLAPYTNENLRIYGDYPVPLPNYVGKVSTKEIANILRSSDAVIDINKTWWRNAALYNEEVPNRDHILLNETYLNSVITKLENFTDTTRLQEKVKYIYEKYRNIS